MGVYNLNILQVAQTCAQRLQLPTPSSFVASTDNNMILLNSMINRAIQEIRNDFPWPELQREYSFTLVNNQDTYPLPGDFDRTSTETLWNRTQKWPLIGPLDAVEWEVYKSGIVTTFPRQRFRIKYWGINQFFVDPVPTGTENNQIIVYEYISKNVFMPKAWAPSTVFGASAYCSYNGNIYETTGGTTGTIPMTLGANGQGQDGTVFWTAIPSVNAWAQSTVYTVNTFVSNGGNVYRCVANGKSSSIGTGPSGFGISITDNSVTWSASPVVTWAAETQYAFGTVMHTSGNVFYYCSTPTSTGNGVQQSGGIEPNWTSTTQSDGSLTWTFINTYFDMPQNDSDTPILDAEMIIDGAVWRFKQERGLNFDDLRTQALEQIETAKSRLGGSGVLSMSEGFSNGPLPIGLWSYPEGSFGM